MPRKRIHELLNEFQMMPYDILKACVLEEDRLYT